MVVLFTDTEPDIYALSPDTSVSLNMLFNKIDMILSYIFHIRSCLLPSYTVNTSGELIYHMIRLALSSIE